MNRHTILLTAAITTFALTCSAADYEITRLLPPESSLAVLTDAKVDFKALFSLLRGYGWNKAEWWVDAESVLTDTALGAHDGITLFGRQWSDAGSHTVKVRANYDSLPFGVDVWTDYLTWTVTVVSPDTYTVERTLRSEQSTEIVHNVVGCGAEFSGLVSQATWQQVEWYTDGVLYSAGALSEGLWGYVSDIYPTFTIGTHEVKVRAQWSLNGAEVWTDYTVWSIDVVPHPPTASRVAPSSPVSMMQGGTQAFTARGTDVGDVEHRLEIAGVRWYIDGALQSDMNLGAKWTSTVDNTWSHTFDASGTYQVEAVFYDYEGYSSPSGQTVWTVVVEQQVHEPSGTIVSPSSSVTIFQGEQKTFTLRGTDSGNDLRLCEVSLDGAFQANASFSGAASGSTAEWTHTFNSPGTYSVAFTPLDLAGASGAACTWTVQVEEHDPSGSIVNPNSDLTVLQNTPVTFTLEGSDPADDLRHCEVSVNGVFQTNASFSGSTSGSIAEWTHSFNLPGTYYVRFTPLDLAGNSGATCTWAVEVEADVTQAGLNVLVIGLDAQGAATGSLAGAKVDLTGAGVTTTATTDGQGQFTLAGLNPGTYAVNVSKIGYYSHNRTVPLAAGETKDEVFRLTTESPEPSAFDFASPNGTHFIGGMPGSLSCSLRVAWSGSPGSVRFKVADAWHEATITNLGGGKAQADLSVPIPSSISTCSELEVEVANGEGETTTVNTGVYLYPLPSIIGKWFPFRTWEVSGLALGFTYEESFTLLEGKIGEVYSIEASAGLQKQLSFDPRGGTFSGSIGGFGGLSQTLKVDPVELLGEGRLDLTGTVRIALAGYDLPTITPGWSLSLAGKAGVGAPATVVIDVLFPPAAPAMKTLRKVPVVKNIINALKLRLYLIGGGALSGEYEGGKTGECFLGTTSISGSLTLGVEGQVVLEIGAAEAGIYAGGTGTPEFQLCPAFEFEGVTLRAYVGVFASTRLYTYSKEVGVTIRIGDAGEQKFFIASMPESDLQDAWQPTGGRCLRWGRTNLLASERGLDGFTLSAQGEPSQETALVENVVPLASPVLSSGSLERLILFCLHDPDKPWYAATDMGAVRQADGGPWTLDRIADDDAAEFSPSVVSVDSGRTLAAWERVSGDISDTSEPDQIAPHLEIVAAWFDSATGLWSTPEQLTSNAETDCQPMAIALGATSGILWIAGEDGAVASAGRLMFAKWSGNGWEEAQMLWSAQRSIANFAFVADDAGEGHVVLAVDEDGDPNTTADCELYLLSTVHGAWQTAVQLTSDLVEDAMPTLVAPNGVPMCVWSADGALVYSRLDDWNPREIYSESTLANEAPSLDAVTMPGGAAVAYTVQGPNGVDIVASFYDADLDCWSLPRQLTADEHAETTLSLTCDAGELVIAYLKTQTLRTGMDVEIEGQIHHLENVPQPGRTDLYVLQHTLANDLAVVSESLVVEPANPAPGTAATIRATIENRGDLALQDVEVVFYDGDPSSGAVTIVARQVIPGTLIAGGKQDVSVSWKVPAKESSHEVFVAVDPSLAIEDRDRSNNELSVRTVLPDLVLETCWSTEVSATTMALTARVANAGIIPVNASSLSWRLGGAADGEQIGTSAIKTLIAGGAYEATFLWDTSGHLNAGEHAQVFVVADPAGAVPESDETNNAYSLSVFHAPREP
ncbi:MAG: CARDB domain-containing protein [Phycisphaerales bacterium]